MSITKKKKPTGQPTSISKIDIQFEKIIQITAVIFLIVCLAVLGVIGLFDYLDIMETSVSLNAMSFALILFTGTSSGLTFGMGTIIKNNRDQKRRFFYDWMVGEFFICMIAIFVVGIYQW